MSIGTEEVSLWLTAFSAIETPDLLDLAVPLLTRDEVQRAERIRLPVARAEALLGRALLRVVLGREIGCGAQEVPLRAEPHSKPYLAARQCEFNLAHAGGHIALAVGRGASVGIDLEAVDRPVEFLDIAKGNFAPAEIETLRRAADETDLAREFFRIWTRKEAVVKAAGDGLLLDLASFDVAPRQPTELAVRVDSRESGASTWHVRDLKAPGGGSFAAAIALAQPGLTLRERWLGVEHVHGLLCEAAVAPSWRVA